MVREYHKWFSANLNRDMELLVFGHAGRRVVVFPTREGRFFDYENYKMVSSLSERIEAGSLQLYCVDSVDREALYNFHAHPYDRAMRQVAYENYILREVLPFSAAANDHPDAIAHGCSFGAYHALNIALRHPERFAQVHAYSGRFDLTVPSGHFPSLFDGFYDDNIYYLNPNHYLPNLADEAQLALMRKMRIVLVIGGHDPFIDSNRAISDTMHAKQIPHELYIWDGEAHRFRIWRHMVRHYLV